MSEDQNKVILEKFKGEFPIASYSSPNWFKENQSLVRSGVFVDVETSGLNCETEQIIEIGVRPFTFNKDSGELLYIGEGYSALQEPSKPLSEDIQRITGLNDEILKGKKIDFAKVNKLLSNVDIVIAHNAAFDRSFIDIQCSSSKDSIWGCSLRQIRWAQKGFSSSSLEFLSIKHGFFTDSHRALNDADSGLFLLSFKDEKSKKPYLVELFNMTRTPVVHIVAKNSKFDDRFRLKDRQYQWDNPSKQWSKYILKDDLSKELSWLNENIYGNSNPNDISFGPEYKELKLNDSFKQRR